MDKTNKYQCTIKLIDETVHESKKNSFVPVTIFAKTVEEIPRVPKVGSVIRLHRAQTKKFKGKTQLNCDVNIKGAWVIFDPVESQNPIDTSGKNFTFVERDRALLKESRKFAKEYFAKTELHGTTLQDAEDKKMNEFDVLCMVMEVKKKGEVDHVKLCDPTKVVKLDIPRSRKIAITAGEIVRLRGVSYSDGKKDDVLKMEEYSNILRVPDEYKSAKELTKAVEGNKANSKVKAKMAEHTPHLNSPMVASKVLDPHKVSKVTALKDLFGGSGKGKYFKVHVGVAHIGPKDPKDWICAIDRKTKTQYTLSEAFKGKKTGKLPAGMDYYIKFQLFVQDKSAKTDTSMYTLFLCTMEGKGAEFIDVNLGREYPNEKHLSELKKIAKTLTNPWVTLDLMVESVEVASKQPVFFLVDTKLTI